LCCTPRPQFNMYSSLPSTTVGPEHGQQWADRLTIACDDDGLRLGKRTDSRTAHWYCPCLLSTVPLPSRRLAGRESRRYFALRSTIHNSQSLAPLTTINHHSSTLCPRSPCRLADSPAGSPVATLRCAPQFTVHNSQSLAP
jgi:hypothetical protein